MKGSCGIRFAPYGVIDDHITFQKRETMSTAISSANVILASMPYVDVLRPPLGISVLIGVLRSRGICAKAIYPCISLAENLPYDLYQWFGASVQNRFGDYFFANRIFGFDLAREKSFVEHVTQLDDCGRYPALSILTSGAAFVKCMPKLQAICDAMLDYWVDIVCSSPTTNIVACSASCVQLHASLAFLKEVKARRPDIVTMIGGSECEGDAAIEIAQRFDFVDYVLSGDGEETLPHLTQMCLDGWRPRGSDLPFGVFDNDKARDARIESPKVGANEFGYPDDSDYVDAVRRSELFNGITQSTSIEFSRGCWKGERAHCTFCGINGDRIAYRCKTANRILQELERAYARGVRFFFTTDTVLDMHAMMPALENFRVMRHDVAFICDVVATLSESQLARLADCGVLYVQVGIESLHPRHVQLMNKSNSPSRSVAFLKFAQENHIHVFWNILASIPGDSPKEYAEMATLIPSLEHLPPPSFSRIRFDRFSEYWKMPKKFGLKLVPMSNCGFLYPQDGRIDLMRLSMYFDNASEDVRTMPDDPSMRRCELAVQNWIERYSDAVLRQDDAGTIIDTRSCAVENLYKSTAEERKLLALLRAPVKDIDLEGACLSGGLVEYMPVLQELTRRKYVIHWDRCWLSLVMKQIGENRDKEIRGRCETALAIRQYESSRVETQVRLRKAEFSTLVGE